MFHRRETGSVTLPASRDKVFEIVRDQLDPASTVTTTGHERVDLIRGSDRSTFVLRDVPGGTRVFHARVERPGLRSLLGPRDELREAVEADLFRIQRLVDLTRERP